MESRLASMVVKEVRQGLRRVVFVILFMIIHVLAVAALSVEFYSGFEHGSGSLGSVLPVHLLVEESPFWLVTGLVCMVMMPMGGLVLMRQEMDDGNYELLQLTTLSRWDIVFGKFVAVLGLSVLIFISLTPYLVVRYFIGGVEVWRNVVLSLTVLLGAAVVTAGSVGASAYKNLFARTVIFLLFMCSLVLSGVMVLALSISNSWLGVMLYYLNVVSFVLCYVILGLSLARSRIRVTVHHYEMKPNRVIIALCVVTPVIVGITSLLSCGQLGFVGCLVMAFLTKFADSSPKAPSWVKVPDLNIPK